MLTRVSHVPFLLLFGFWSVSGYSHIAGSCNSPQSGHHGVGLGIGGGYNLEVKDPQKVYSPGQEVVLVLRESDDSRPFEGFQIICETCGFPYIERSVVAQINDRHCELSGRISHIDDRPKSRVEITAKLPQDISQDVVIEYYVVQHHKEWYGPMKLTLQMNTSPSPLSSPSPSTSSPLSSPSSSPSLSPSQCSCPSYYQDVCSSTTSSSPSSFVKSEWSFETCQPPSEGSYKSIAKLSDYFTMYWSLHDIKDECPSVDILVAAKTKGWGSLGFTEKSGRMYPADAALGWIEEDGSDCHLKAYRIKGYDIHERDANASLLEMKCISREDGLLYIGFNKRAQCGYVHVDLEEDVNVIFAIAKENALVEHNKFGSAFINFQSGEFHVTTYMKDYKAHGALMVIAWIVFVPLAILIARYKWSPPRIERIAWIDLHKWINYFVVLCVVVALLVAIITFPPIVTKIGQAHRIIGILISILLGIQVAVAVFRPGPEEPWRPIFNVVHAWTGRGLFVFAIVETFLGISAFHKVTGSSTVPWVVCVVLLLVLYAIIVILIETKLRWALYKEGGGTYISMTEVEYSYPEFDNDEE